MGLTAKQKAQGYTASGGFRSKTTTTPKPVTISTPKPVIQPIAQPIVDPKTYLTQQQIQGGYSTIPGQYNAVTGKLNSMTTESLTTEPAIPSPDQTAAQQNAAYQLSAQQDLQNAIKAQNDAYKKQSDALAKQAKDAQKKIDEYNAANEGIITNQVKPLTDPFRQELEKTERERLSVNKNFEENQKLTDELGTLLTEGNTLVEQMRGVTGLTGIRNPRIAQAIEGVNARSGVIQAVMSARNGQIAQAGNLIDRSVQTIVADRNDQLNYYNTLINFKEGLKDDEGKKLVSISAKQQAVLENQMRILENETRRIQDNADALKEAMTNPSTAMTYGNAGITLLDTPEQISFKLAKYAYTEEVRNTSNTMSGKGYQSLTAEQIKGKPEDELIRYTDSNGKEQVFWRKPDMAESDIRSVDGGLYDVTGRTWIVRPKSGGGSGASGSRVLGNYVVGNNPAVDAWVSQINDGKATIANVPANLKNAVVEALSSSQPSDTGLESPEVEILKNKIQLIDGLIIHEGLNSSVGPVYGARIGFADRFGAGADFAGGVHQLINKETIDTLINLKARGGTLGALSDQERILLQQAATKIGTWEIPDENGFPSGKFRIDEASFKRELEQIKSLAQKALERAGGLLQSEDMSEIDILYEAEGEIDPANYY